MYWRIWELSPVCSNSTRKWLGWYGVWATKEAAERYYTKHPGNAQRYRDAQENGWGWAVLPHDEVPTLEATLPKETNLITPEDEDNID